MTCLKLKAETEDGIYVPKYIVLNRKLHGWKQCFVKINMTHIHNYWVLGLFPSSSILESRKHDVSETGSVSVLRRRGEKIPTQLGPLETVNLNHWKPLLILCVIHHLQNPLESTYNKYYLCPVCTELGLHLRIHE
jgi:hypothetical protein